MNLTKTTILCIEQIQSKIDCQIIENITEYIQGLPTRAYIKSILQIKDTRVLNISIRGNDVGAKLSKIFASPHRFTILTEISAHV